MTQEHKRERLLAMMHTDEGRADLVRLYCIATDTPIFQMLPIGMLYSQIVEVILQNEDKINTAPPKAPKV